MSDTPPCACRTVARERTAAPNNSTVKLLDQNTRRRAVVIAADSAVAFSLTFDPSAAVGTGLRIPPGNHLEKLTVHDLGDAIRRELYVNAAAAVTVRAWDVEEIG